MLDGREKKRVNGKQVRREREGDEEMRKTGARGERLIYTNSTLLLSPFPQKKMGQKRGIGNATRTAARCNKRRETERSAGRQSLGPRRMQMSPSV